MVLVYLIILLIIIGIIFLVLGGVKKSKKLSMIGIMIFIIIIAFSIGFAIRALYEKNKQEEKESNAVNSNIYNEEMITEHYKNNLQEIPKELTVEEAVKRNFFVFDAVEEKVYNEEKLKILETLEKEDNLYNLKFMTKEEYLRNYFFSYQDNALLYLMKKYHYKI